MEQKLIEVRDSATRLHVLAIRMGADNDAENFILQSSGYGVPYDQRTYTLMMNLDNPRKVWLNSTECLLDHPHTRTFPAAHKELADHWDKYSSGDVLDVQFILGETSEPKRSDRFYIHDVGNALDGLDF